MLENAIWIVEYSPSKKDFQLREMGRSIEDNLIACVQGVSRDYQFIGVFHAKESALIFIEGFKLRLTAGSAAHLSACNGILSVEESGMLYEETLDFINKIIDTKPHGFTKNLCKESKLTYQTVIGLLRKTINFKAPELIMELLVALGYEVKMTRTMQMKEEKKEEEIITYFISAKEFSKAEDVIPLLAL